MSSFDDPRSVFTHDAPAAVGPYSQGVRAGQLLFISGQLPIDPATGAFASGGIAEHAHQCLKNLSAIAREAGTGLERAVKVTEKLPPLPSEFSGQQLKLHLEFEQKP